VRSTRRGARHRLHGWSTAGRPPRRAFERRRQCRLSASRAAQFFARVNNSRVVKIIHDIWTQYTSYESSTTTTMTTSADGRTDGRTDGRRELIHTRDEFDVEPLPHTEVTGAMRNIETAIRRRTAQRVSCVRDRRFARRYISCEQLSLPKSNAEIASQTELRAHRRRFPPLDGHDPAALELMSERKPVGISGNTRGDVERPMLSSRADDRFDVIGLRWAYSGVHRTSHTDTDSFPLCVSESYSCVACSYTGHDLPPFLIPYGSSGIREESSFHG